MSKFISEGLDHVGDVWILNCTPHDIKFKHEVAGDVKVIPNAGFTLKASVEFEVAYEQDGVEYVRSTYKGSEEVNVEWQEINDIKSNLYKQGIKIVVVGSIISAQAYPGLVVSPIPVKGEERLHPAERHYSATRFNIF